MNSTHDANKGIADGPTPMEVDIVEGKSKDKGKKDKGKGGWNIPWGAGRGLVAEVEEKQKVKARKDAEEATTKEERRRARKERAKMVRN